MTRGFVLVGFAAAAGLLLLRRAAATPGLTGSIQEFVAEVRAGMAEREAELRTELGLDGRHDVVDAGL